MKKKTCGSDENDIKVCCPNQESKLFDLKTICGYSNFKGFSSLALTPDSTGKLKILIYNVMALLDK